ncbi:hypothetical protein [Bernardetia litoralis]|uniref:hypothetical protein n=1 Tax=Bernardetia litoralis TaxID=999 RepID=UPI0002E4C938|nr:hypothetical protein [Bernardetia litoralis]
MYQKNKISFELKSILKFILFKVKSTWKQISILEKIALFIPLIIYIAFWWIYGWQNDEVFSYTFFVDRGILVCATYYPAPNNHVAFLIFSAILNKIIPSFFSDFICLKLPATLSAIFYLWFLWLFFYRKNQKKLAWICFVLIAFMWSFFFYATHGRGYAWIILFFLWSCFAVFKIISNKNRNSHNLKKYWFLWSFSLILGCYTIPIFIYVWFASLLGLWLIGTNKIRKESIVISFISGLIILLLYTPILFFNGLSAIISNSWVAPLNFENWSKQFPLYLWNVHGIIGVSAFVASLGLFFIKKEFRKLVIYFWCIAYSPYLIVFIQKVLPFERVFLYRQIAEIVMLCFCVGVLSEKIYISFAVVPTTTKIYQKYFQILFISLAIFYASFRMYGEYYHWNIKTNVYQFAEPLAKKIYNKKPTSILVLEDTYNVFLRYYFRNLDTKVEVSPSSIINYQIIILPKESQFPKTDSLKYSIFYEDNFVKGFERK